MVTFLEKLLGDPNRRAVKGMEPLVSKINSLESSISPLSDEELKGKTAEFKERLEKGATLDDLLPEAFAVVRETAKRVLGERHFDVQLLGGIALHQGKIPEMKTGEGKTLVSTLPVYLNALAGKGVHIVTVNDYLAKRDAGWMGQIYNFLGLTVGVVTHETPPEEKKTAYAADITYGTNNEFGFDYLRDNMAGRAEDQVQRKLFYAIVDEVDSILIDEARTPLIISAPDEESTDLYKKFAEVAKHLEKEVDYTTEDKTKTPLITEAGIIKIEKLLGVSNVYESGNVELVHHIEQALRATEFYHKDKEYVVKDGEILIVDEFTGRLMPGRRYSEGLHQAIEAKEGVEIRKESKTLATITFQNYFRLYEKLGGMTGTAKTEEEEFWKIYGLEVVVIPTNKVIARRDDNDLIYVSEVAKFNAVVEEIKRLHEKGQPVLVGTIAIEKSELLSDLLKRDGVPHEVLNAKNHEREAEIVKDAGQKGAVTIATNMAGRGTDIKLGEGVREVGGLHVLGTERHESRRIDNQLRGRAGRQGDPGSSRFFVSLEDDLMKLFGSDRIKNMMKSLRIPEDQPLEHKWISSSIETAQKRVEGHNFDIRKRVVEYDDVMNRHRETIYRQRQAILEQSAVTDTVQDYVENELRNMAALVSVDANGVLETESLFEVVETIFPLSTEEKKVISEATTPDQITDILIDLGVKKYKAKEEEAGEDNMRQAERIVLLRAMDVLWMEHLDAMMKLREAIGLSGYGQRDPLVEYKQEAFSMFQRLQAETASDVARMIFKVRVVNTPAPQQVSQEVRAKQALALAGQTAAQPLNEELVESGPTEPETGFAEEAEELIEEAEHLAEEAENTMETLAHMQADAELEAAEKITEQRETTMLPSTVRDPQAKKEKIGRNDPCWCGSGLKYKKCGMLNTAEHQQNMAKL